MRLFSDRLLGEVMAFCSPDLLRDSLSLDGKRGDLDALLQTLARSMPSYDGTVPQAPPSGVALPLLAEGMAVPEEAGQVNPADWLDPLKAVVFENLESLRLPEEAWQEIPVSCHRVPLEQEAAVMRKLLDTNMVVLVPESELPRAQDGRLLIGGLFAVKKNSSEDRLIFHEIISLRKKDLAFPDTIASGEESLGLVGLVRQPKTKRSYRTQMVLVKEAKVVKWNLSADQLVFPMTGVCGVVI